MHELSSVDMSELILLAADKAEISKKSIKQIFKKNPEVDFS
jgi:hypothetical protein